MLHLQEATVLKNLKAVEQSERDEYEQVFREAYTQLALLKFSKLLKQRASSTTEERKTPALTSKHVARELQGLQEFDLVDACSAEG